MGNWLSIEKRYRKMAELILPLQQIYKIKVKFKIKKIWKKQ